MSRIQATKDFHFAEWLADRLPRRVVSFAVLRMIREAMPKQTVANITDGTLKHPDEIGIFQLLQMYDPQPGGSKWLMMKK